MSHYQLKVIVIVSETPLRTASFKPAYGARPFLGFAYCVPLNNKFCCCRFHFYEEEKNSLCHALTLLFSKTYKIIL